MRNRDTMLSFPFKLIMYTSEIYANSDPKHGVSAELSARVGLQCSIASESRLSDSHNPPKGVYTYFMDILLWYSDRRKDDSLFLTT